MKNALRHRDFRTLFAVLTVSMLSESILVLALGIWVKDLTGSDGLAGAAFLALSVPMFLAPVAGWVVDLVSRRTMFVVLNLITAVLLIPLLAVREVTHLWIIYVVAAGYGLSYIMLGATANALVPELVPTDDLPHANAAVQTVKQALRLIGPLAGAGLYSLVGGPGLAAGCAVVFVAAGLAGLLLGTPGQLSKATDMEVGRGWMREVGAGVRHLLGDRVLRRVVIGSALSMIGLGVGESLYFAYVDQGLGREPAFLGVLVSTQGVGGVAGGLVAAFIVRRWGQMAAVAVGVALFGVGNLGLSHPTLWLALPASVLIGVGLPISMVGMNTLLQRRTPDHILGRAAAALDALVSGPQALAIGLGAVLVSLADYRLLFASIGVLMVLVSVSLWFGRQLPSRVPATTRLIDETTP